MENALKRALARAVAFLEKNGYRYAVIGGIATQFWGSPRLTLDLDIKVLVPETDYPAVRAAIRSEFPERARPQTPLNPLIVDVIVGTIVVDFLLAVPGYEEKIIERAARRDVDGFQAWVCSAEDLIIQKVIAHRPKDWQDVESVIAERGTELDTAYIQKWLKEFVEVLEKPELIEQYAAILKRAKKFQRRTENKGAT